MEILKILLVNKFLYPKGGDAISTINTGKLLSAKGHNVIFWGMKHSKNSKYPYKEYFIENTDYYKPMKIREKINNSLKILYSFEAKRRIEELINVVKPNIVHLNNFSHQISPSILDVFARYKIPSVMTMHDYKLVCPSYSLLRDGRPCEKCRNAKYFWCFFKKCTKDSCIKSLLNVVEMYLHHKTLHIYDKIDVFISPSKFLKEKVKEMGFKRNIFCLSNFISTKDYVPDYNFKDTTICYFGRLSKEKGLFTLINAMKGLEIKLKIIGDGPIKESLKFKVKSEKLDNVDFLGYKSGEELKNEIKNSIAVVLPSQWYENYPHSIIEAFTLGKPVIGAQIGGIPELVRDEETGFTFEPGNAQDLREKIISLLENKDKIIEMGRRARAFVEEELNPEKHYEGLMKIYERAIAKCS